MNGQMNGQMNKQFNEKHPMDFHANLCATTACDRQQLLSRPILSRVVTGTISRGNYAAFLVNAWHHVRHTVPLMMAMGSRLSETTRWMLSGLTEYINEEIGHEAWIENDLRAFAPDADQLLSAPASFEVEVMVRYMYDYIARENPVGFLGMVHVLEGTSTSLATQMAALVQQTLQLPDTAFSYLRSHGDLDQEHVVHFATLVNRIEHQADRDSIVHVTRTMYRLYGAVLDQSGTCE